MAETRLDKALDRVKELEDALQSFLDVDHFGFDDYVKIHGFAPDYAEANAMAILSKG